MPAPTVKLSSGYSIPVVGLGVYLTPQNEARKIVYDALKVGYRHIDSAQYYENEQEVGEAIVNWINEDLANKREDVFYTTKVAAGTLGYDSVRASVKKSLELVKDLGYIDLMLIHAPFGTKQQRLESWKALQEFVEEGVIRSIGVSNYGNHHLKELLEWDGLKIKPVVNQVEINPWLCRKELVDYNTANGILIEAYSPLTRGMRLNDSELKALAKKYGKTTSQILLRWSLQKGYIVLPKTISPSRLEPNLEVFDFELSPEDEKSLTHEDQYYVTMPEWDPVTYKG
ncbi:NADP-dependent oxidoreductase domain-containing protein [Dipodascopsis uninucleata]